MKGNVAHSFRLFVVSVAVAITLVTLSTPAVAQAVSAPGGGTTWHHSEDQTISWSGLTGSYVRIELLLGTQSKGSIIRATLNNGSYTWHIPTNLKQSSQYHVKVTSLTRKQSATSGAFTIMPPVATVTGPNGGEYFYRGDTMDITWTTSAPGGSVRLELLKGNSPVTIIAMTAANNGHATWTIPFGIAKSDRYRVRVTSTGLERPSDVSDGYFEIGDPSMAVTYPNNSTVTWKRGGIYNITWTNTGEPGPRVRIDLYKGSSRKYSVSKSAPNTGTCTFLVPANAVPGSDYRVCVASLHHPDYMDFSDQPFTISSETLPGCKIEVVTPSGDPTSSDPAVVGSSEVCFTGVNPGTLTVRCQFTVQAGTIPGIMGMVRACVSTVGDSTLTWRNPTTGVASPWTGPADGLPAGASTNAGQALYNSVTGYFEVDAVFTGLPTSNTGFGLKRVWGQVVQAPNVLAQDDNPIEVFYPREANNNPGTGRDDGPNWFYYWRTGGAVAVDTALLTAPVSAPGWEYDNDPWSYGYYIPGDDNIYVCDLAATDDPSSPFPLTNKVTGITIMIGANGVGPQMCAITIAHEFLHKWYYDSWNTLMISAADASPWGDPDGDGMPNNQEPIAEGLNTLPDDPDTYDMASYNYGYASYGDQEIRCRKREMNVGLSGVSVHTDLDWASPGSNSCPPYTGP